MKELIERMRELFNDIYEFTDEKYADWGSYAVIEAVEKIIEDYKKEQANKTFLDRLKEERDDLAEKFDKLSIFMNDKEKFSEISANQQKYLETQHFFMKGYLSVLDTRLEDFAKNGELENARKRMDNKGNRTV